MRRGAVRSCSSSSLLGERLEPRLLLGRTAAAPAAGRRRPRAAESSAGTVHARPQPVTTRTAPAARRARARAPRRDRRRCASATPIRRPGRASGLPNSRTCTSSADARAPRRRPRSAARRRSAIGEDHRARAGRDQRDLAGRDRQAEDRAHVQRELAQRLRRHRHHAGVVRPRRDLAEEHLVAAHEQLDAEDPGAAERVGDRRRRRDRGSRARRPLIGCGCQLSR